jgi:hypothetical protein
LYILITFNTQLKIIYYYFVLGTKVFSGLENICRQVKYSFVRKNRPLNGKWKVFGVIISHSATVKYSITMKATRTSNLLGF